MNITFRLAWRNLWRQPRRTWLTTGAMIFSNVILVFLISLQLAQYRMMIDNSLRAYTGHLQVQAEGYQEKKKIRRVIEDPEAHLHPMTLASVWSVLEGTRLQKVVTTHSSELVADVPLRALRRLYAMGNRWQDLVEVLGVHPLHGLGSLDGVTEDPSLSEVGALHLELWFHQHDQLGAMLFDQWSFPCNLCEAVGGHHDCWGAEDPAGVSVVSVDFRRH